MRERVIMGSNHILTQKRIEREISKTPGFELVEICNHGATLYNRILKCNPDIVLLQMTMPGMDSLRLIELVRENPKYDTVHFLLLGARGQKRALEYLRQKDRVGFIHYDNPDKAIVEAMQLLLKQRRTSKRNVSATAFPDALANERLLTEATGMMQTLGIPANIKGYLYLRSAVVLAADNMEYLNALTKRLYPEVARLYHTTPERIERAIRRAVLAAWENNPEGTRETLGLYSSQAKVPAKPTNSEFIAVMADRLRFAQ